MERNDGRSRAPILGHGRAAVRSTPPAESAYPRRGPMIASGMTNTNQGR